MKSLKRTRIVVLGFAAALLGGPVHAAFLYWSKIQVKTGTEAKCMQLAYGVASKNLQGVKRSALEVAGSKGAVYIAITCVGRASGQNAIGVVMAVGDNGPATSATRDLIVEKLSNTQFID